MVRRETVPTYQYACTACGHRFEAVQAFTDATLTECPKCAGRLRKVFSSIGIVFKGSGFYRTDSRAGSTASSGSGSEKKTEAASASSGSGDSASSSSSSSSSAKSELSTSSAKAS
jgi:putative FmdB family regulatory protein